MKKFTFIFGLIVILFSLSSCVTMNQVEYGKTFASHSPIEFENEDVKATLTFNNAGKRYHPPIFSSLKNPIPCAAMEVAHEAAQYERTNRPYYSMAVER